MKQSRFQHRGSLSTLKRSLWWIHHGWMQNANPQICTESDLVQRDSLRPFVCLFLFSSCSICSQPVCRLSCCFQLHLLFPVQWVQLHRNGFHFSLIRLLTSILAVVEPCSCYLYLLYPPAYVPVSQCIFKPCVRYTPLPVLPPRAVTLLSNIAWNTRWQQKFIK